MFECIVSCNLRLFESVNFEIERALRSHNMCNSATQGLFFEHLSAIEYARFETVNLCSKSERDRLLATFAAET